MAVGSVLTIAHAEGSSPPSFVLTRLSDNKSAPPVTIPSPYDFPVPGQPTSNLMRELRWYLEGFLDYPFPPETGHAERVLDALKSWGAQAFNALFDRRDAPDWLQASSILQVRSDDAGVLSWPWEALFDPQANFVAHHRRIERRLNRLADPPKLGKLPKDRVNILLVVARPYKADVRYRSIAQPLVELIRTKRLPAHVDVLRPPTFDQLREHLRAYPNHYHVLHFDGHGAYGSGNGEYSSHKFQGHQGHLIFENAQGDPDPQSASALSALLHEYAVPAVVLNACQSAMLDSSAEGAFASVATALLQSGMRSVVAMAYSLYVSGAQVFLPAFYRRLFEEGSPAEAVRAGRQQMLANQGRVCARGRYPLEDWLLPVLYQQDPHDFSFAAKATPAEIQSRLPEELRKHRDEYGFIGRDGPILEMERALHRQAPAILIEGLGGVGKTALARGFLRWLDETGGLDGALWFDFRDIRNADFVINQIGQAFYGENFRLGPNKLELLEKALTERRVIIVWDNFESTATNLTADHRADLGRFLDHIRGGRSKVIITSRSTEDWLKPSRRFELPLRGLDGEERWEYCETILRELGLKVDRNDPELSKLMNQLAGHPLAMRAVLPKLEAMPAAKIAEALRTNIKELGLDENEEQGRLFATLRLVEKGLAEDLRPILALVGLHEGYADADHLEAMAKQVDAEWTRERIDSCMTTLAYAGLLRYIGQATYEIHPLLTSYLRSATDATCQTWSRAFVNVMAELADWLTPRDLHEWRVPFLLHGANLHFACSLAARFEIEPAFPALTQSLASHALRTGNLAEAEDLYNALAKHSLARKDLRETATAYHQLGAVAHAKRDFAAAREWYLESLAIKNELGNKVAAASTYHQLGRISYEQHEFDAAREWLLRALEIEEAQTKLRNAAGCYHQLGMLAAEQGEFVEARKWYLEALATKESEGDTGGAASTLHQLGSLALAQRDFESANGWFLKSLAISEEYENEEHQAATCHQLGLVAENRHDFVAAREWYLRTLAIKEKRGNLHGAASTYGQLGIIAGLQDRFEECGGWLIRSIAAAQQTGDIPLAERNSRNFAVFHWGAPVEDKPLLEGMWRKALLSKTDRDVVNGN